MISIYLNLLRQLLVTPTLEPFSVNNIINTITQYIIRINFHTSAIYFIIG